MENNLKISFIRHANGIHNLYNYQHVPDPYNHPDCFDAELTPKGILQSMNISYQIKDIYYTHIYCSPIRRTIQTCDNLVQNRLIILDDRLIESNVCNLCNRRSKLKYLTNYVQNRNNKYDLSKLNEITPIDETDVELKLRINSFLNDIKKNHKSSDNILIVTHAGFLNVIFEKRFINCELREFNLLLESTNLSLESKDLPFESKNLSLESKDLSLESECFMLCKTLIPTLQLDFNMLYINHPNQLTHINQQYQLTQLTKMSILFISITNKLIFIHDINIPADNVVWSWTYICNKFIEHSSIIIDQDLIISLNIYALVSGSIYIIKSLQEPTKYNELAKIADLFDKPIIRELIDQKLI